MLGEGIKVVSVSYAVKIKTFVSVEIYFWIRNSFMRFSVAFGRTPIMASVVLATAFVLSASSPSQAVFIQPSSAVASSQFNAGFDAQAVNTINGSGLPSGFGPGSTHAAYASGNHWATDSGTTPTTQFITWGFTTAQTLDTIYIWNHQSTVPPANNPGYDVTLFDLTLFDASFNVLLTLNDVGLAPDTATSQAFSFGGPIANVSSVRFDVEAVQGSPNFTGLAEVGFNTATSVAAPEPSSIAFALVGGICLMGAVVRRRKA
jgi:hypothetical protein